MRHLNYPADNSAISLARCTDHRPKAMKPPTLSLVTAPRKDTKAAQTLAPYKGVTWYLAENKRIKKRINLMKEVKGQMAHHKITTHPLF